MAQKTISELDEVLVASDNTDVVVDTGVQTFKMKIGNMLKSAHAALVLTSTERDALSSPAEGWEIYNSTQKCKQVYTGVDGWINLGPQTGDLVPSALASAKPGFLAGDGSAVSRTDYADLYAAIGTTFGSGDGSTTFNVPDTRRRVPMGKGGTAVSGPANTLGATGGAETHTLTGAESGTSAHSHSISDPTHSHLASVGGNGADNQASTRAWSTNGSGSYFNSQQMTSVATGITINNSSAASASSAHNNVQPSLVVSYFIKY